MNIDTTMRYAHLAPEHLDVVVATLDRTFSEMDTCVDKVGLRRRRSQVARGNRQYVSVIAPVRPHYPAR